MADQVAAKKILSELSKREDLKNKTCNDCTNLNPQWASVSFAVFLCLQCAGTHRGYGVHVSFVRSISMDTWQDEQVKRMQLGGNVPFREFVQSYVPVEQGGYNDNLNPYDKYHCWAATQYREKLDAELAGKSWTPSAPPPSSTPNNRSSSPNPTSSSGLRKSRASTRSGIGSSLRSDSASPSSLRGSPRGTPDLSNDQKSLNESYFTTLGKANESRPVDLPPSQGGRYQGFGNTPTPPSQHPSYGLSSSAAPSLVDLQENPLGALGKGWSLLSSAVVGAGRVVSENVIQPSVERVTDPNFQASVKGYMTEAQKRAAAAGGAVNQWSKQQLGVDVGGSVGGMVGSVKDRFSDPSRSGYGAVPTENYGEGSSLYQDGSEDSFFHEYDHDHDSSTSLATSVKVTPIPAKKGTRTPPKKNSEWDDDWKDF